MTQFKLENHNAVALLNRLRIACRATQVRERRPIFNGLCDALKGLGMIPSKDKVEAIYEGIDGNGNHWFMVDLGEDGRLPSDTEAAANEQANARHAPYLPAEITEPYITAELLRTYADHPAQSGFVPIHPNTLRRIADELDRLLAGLNTTGG